MLSRRRPIFWVVYPTSEEWRRSFGGVRKGVGGFRLDSGSGERSLTYTRLVSQSLFFCIVIVVDGHSRKNYIYRQKRLAGIGFLVKLEVVHLDYIRRPWSSRWRETSPGPTLVPSRRFLPPTRVSSTRGYDRGGTDGGDHHPHGLRELTHSPPVGSDHPGPPSPEVRRHTEGEN